MFRKISELKRKLTIEAHSSSSSNFLSDVFLVSVINNDIEVFEAVASLQRRRTLDRRRPKRAVDVNDDRVSDVRQRRRRGNDVSVDVDLTFESLVASGQKDSADKDFGDEDDDVRNDSLENKRKKLRP